MAYDRYDARPDGRSERPRWRDDPRAQRPRDERDERGWFERAGDEVASWFGDEDAERRRRHDSDAPQGRGWSGPGDRGNRDRFAGHLRNEDDVRSYYDHDRDRGGFDRPTAQRFRSQRDEDRSGWFGDSQRDHGDRSHRGFAREGKAFMSDQDFSSYERRPGFRDEGYRRPYTGRFASRSDAGDDRDRGQPYRPMTGDYGRGQQVEDRMDRGASYYGAGSAGGGLHDRHYGQLRRRHVDQLDRDYDDYSREHQSKFENDFSSWRDQRQAKRGLLGQIREHMEVLGSDGEHVGTVDRTAGDRLILTKSDEASGGAHHSLMCTIIDRVEGNQVFLDKPADEARQQWRDEDRERALFERDDQGEAGPGTLNRSFSGTY